MTTTVRVVACERCLTVPAQVYDLHRGEALCPTCCCAYCAAPDSDGECSYCCEFVLGYIPRDVPEAWPGRPTVEVTT